MRVDQPLKLGFIGGSIESAVGYTHKIACEMDSRWRLEAGCFSRNSSTNNKTAIKWGIENSHLYLDYKELLKREINRLDAIVVLTPTPLHYEMVTEALSMGYPVICEKALATSSREGKAILKELDRVGGFLAVTHNYTGYPMIREAKNMLTRGDLGIVHQIQIEMPQEGFSRVDRDGDKIYPQEWRLDDGDIPIISLDLGVHLQHMIYYLLGESPSEVVGDQNSFGWFDNVVDDIMLLAKYKSGLRSQMWYSKSALGYRNGLRIRLFGDRGSLEWYQLNPEELKYSDIDGKIVIIDRASDIKIANQERYNRFKSGHPAGFIEAFANIYYDFADKLIDYKERNKLDTNWIYGAKGATMGLDLFEAIDRSSKESRWIKL